MSKDRSYDVVLWGATGFTGRLVAEYLTQRYGALGSEVRWAIAGRNREKLEALRRQLTVFDPRAVRLPILIGRSDDPASLHAIAKQAVTVCATAGPFAKLGSEVVAACLGERTHYCDITGEVQWVRAMIERHHAQAREQGTRIVHCCGYDSVPSDLGVFVLQELAHDRFGAPAPQVRSVVSGKGPNFSGGTFASMINVFEEASRDPSILAMLSDPLALCRDLTSEAPAPEEAHGAHFDADLGAWVTPFVMAAVNTRIVHRSNALLGHPYGSDFSYVENLRTGKGVKAALQASAVALGMAGFERAMTTATARKLVKRVLPEPGEGPTPEQRAGAFFSLAFRGQVPTPTGSKKFMSRFAANGDPGYGETSKMVAESALCLALDSAQLSSKGGVMTPAAAMGKRLVQRLRETGFTIEASEG